MCPKTFKKVTFRPCTKTRKGILGNAIVSTDWISLVNSVNSTDEKAELFLSTLASIYLWALPSKTIKIPALTKPWEKPSLFVLLKAKDRAFREGKTERFLRLREEVTKHISELKMKFYHSDKKKELSSSDSSKLEDTTGAQHGI
jgi:hypothetical protein